MSGGILSIKRLWVPLNGNDLWSTHVWVCRHVKSICASRSGSFVLCFARCSMCWLLCVPASAAGKFLRQAKQDGRHGCETERAVTFLSRSPDSWHSLVKKTSAADGPDRHMIRLCHFLVFEKPVTENVS